MCVGNAVTPRPLETMDSACDSEPTLWCGDWTKIICHAALRITVLPGVEVVGNQNMFADLFERYKHLL
jgi:hypothetical protein